MPQPPSTTSTRDQEHTIDVVRVVVRLRGEQEPEDPPRCPLPANPYPSDDGPVVIPQPGGHCGDLTEHA